MKYPIMPLFDKSVPVNCFILTNFSKNLSVALGIYNISLIYPCHHSLLMILLVVDAIVIVSACMCNFIDLSYLIP